MVVASPEKLHCGEAVSDGEEKEAERAEAEVMTQQLSDQWLREKAQRIQALLNRGMSQRLPDRGRMLLATLYAIRREQYRRQEKEEAERADAEVIAQQLSDQSLREKAQRIQALLTRGMSERLPDRGRKLCATLDAILRGQDRRQARVDGARTPDNSGRRWRVVLHFKLLFNEMPA